MAPIAVGEKIPDGNWVHMDQHGTLHRIDIYKLGFQKKIIIFGLPGAFTPVCSTEHVPGYLETGPLLRKKGVGAIVCLSVNDPFVMRAWAKKYASQNINPRTKDKIVHFVSDGSGLYTKALGMEHDLTRKQMGVRSRRFSILIDNLIVKVVNVELIEGVYDVSKAEHMVTAIERLTSKC